MTPQERELITKLFDRLAALENAPRDPDAERAIAEGLARAPHAVYPLVQTVLVQDEALKAANAKIEELLTELGEPPPQPEQPKGFLDNVRDSLFGRGESAPRAGSVPSVRPGGSPWANAPGYRDEGGYRDQGPPPMGGPGYGAPGGPGYGAPGMGAPGMGAPGFGGSGFGGAPGGGGSFLGTAAATAAGMIGANLLLGGIRNVLGGQGGHQRGPFAGTFNQLSSGTAGSPSSGGAGSGELSHQAGLDDIGRTSSGGGGESTRAGLFGGDEQHDDQYGDDDHDTDDGDEGDYGDDDTGGSDDSDDA
jgi:uncharacterized protein